MSRTTLPAKLPSIANAKLPAAYKDAKTALAKCSRIDECKDWKDKAAAIASYAKQADDKALLTMAVRIKLRATRRGGQLLKQIKRGKGGQPSHSTSTGSGTSRTRADAARGAGLSKRQKHTMLRVASIPEAEFEAVVESNDPPTLTKLAELGTASKIGVVRDKARVYRGLGRGCYEHAEQLDRYADLRDESLEPTG